jgi:hypothetical protein
VKKKVSQKSPPVRKTEEFGLYLLVKNYRIPGLKSSGKID